MNFEIGESSPRLVMHELTNSASVRPLILVKGGCIWWQIAPMPGTQTHGHQGGMPWAEKGVLSSNRLCCPSL